MRKSCSYNSEYFINIYVYPHETIFVMLCDP